ncbi:YdeI/OmpD-associated family protein [Halpernia sp.]|uniref:YdeI/OmpD-associated family protein n=1 Tax=Halpernia sp. TaxID=2782209 RepID=UPI003A959ECF
MNPKVNFLFEKPTKFQSEIKELRKIALKTGLEEDLKWGQATYILNGKNVFLIHQFKDYCAILFFKGALMQDSEKILIQQSANTQATMQLRFTSLKEIKNLEKIIENYLKEAIKIEKSGEKIVLKKTEEFEMPEEFSQVLQEDSTLKSAFEKLTPGRQRAYLLFFASAKQSKTREQRIEKNIGRILEGKGLND